MIDSPSSATPSERYLAQIARQSFLTLWSYPHVFRDQGINQQRQGKEVVDLLVVFDDQVLLFSDKSCAFPSTGDLDLDWSRWYRRAVKASAEQLWGAERWIRENPSRLFLDNACRTRLPISIPDSSVAKFHRIVVANDETGLRRKHIGGSGTLILAPDIVGDSHLFPYSGGGGPFHIGQIDSGRGYVHVLDEMSLRIVLSELDTVKDFIAYLEKKEAFIQSGRLLMAAGEEDLLGFYLGKMNAKDEHDFTLPPDSSRVVLQEGHWHRSLNSPERKSKTVADGVSYAWDAIIEKFTFHAVTGTLARTQAGTLKDQERVYRVLAREPRIRRRLLAEALIEKMKETPKGLLGFRVMLPSRDGDPHYAFLVASENPEWTEQEYREKREAYLTAYCKVVKLRFPSAVAVVGLATEGPDARRRSEDLVLLDCSGWTPDNDEEARLIQARTGWLRAPRMLHEVAQEYPTTPRKRSEPPRNSPCPCGSGRKFKKCCGRVM